MIENARIDLVRGDTRPPTRVTLTSRANNEPIDCTGATPRMRFKREGASNQVLATIVGTLLPGRRNADGTITTTAPFDVPGRGGRASFAWPAGALNVPAGLYQGEIEVTFADGTIQTAVEVARFRIRADF